MASNFSEFTLALAILSLILTVRSLPKHIPWIKFLWCSIFSSLAVWLCIKSRFILLLSFLALYKGLVSLFQAYGISGQVVQCVLHKPFTGNMGQLSALLPMLYLSLAPKHGKVA